MMHYGVRSGGPEGRGNLHKWVVTGVSETVAKVVVSRSNSGSDLRGELGIAVMRSLVDAAAANTLTKYEETARRIHDALETQQTRRDTIAAVEYAVGSVDTGRDFLDRQWAHVLQKLDDDHPLNPRISDARHAIEHLGGMQLHLTSRKRRRIEPEDGGFEVDGGHDGARDHDIAMMHVHNAPHYQERYGDFVRNTADCLLQRVTDPKRRSYNVAKAEGKPGYWLQCDPSDLGEPDCCSATGEKWYLSPEDVPVKFVTISTTEDGIHRLGSNDNAHVLVESPDVRMTACMVDLVMPACLAAIRQSGVYHKAVEGVQRMMRRVRGFDVADTAATAFADASRAAAMGLSADWDVMFLLPCDNQLDPADFVVDFETAGGGWSIGFSPSEQTDAAESAQAFLNGLVSRGTTGERGVRRTVSV